MKLLLCAAGLWFGIGPFQSPPPDVNARADWSSSDGPSYSQFKAKELCKERLDSECVEREPKLFDQRAYAVAYREPFCWNDGEDSAGRVWWTCELTCSAYCHTKPTELPSE